MDYSIVNLGCKVNRVESDEYAALLSGYGKEVPEASADIVIINTCTVTGEAEKKTRKAVRRAIRANDHATILVTGCAAAIDADFYKELSSRVEVITKGSVITHLRQCLIESEAPDNLHSNQHLLRIGDAFNTRVGVKVQDGCDNACTYCIVHTARGKAVSRNFDDCIDECISYAQAGVKEIVLTGINLGSYSWEGKDLGDLLSVLVEKTAPYKDENGMDCRFRVSSVEPKDVSEGFLEVLANSNGRICRHLHLPLQSGSSKVLKEMARPYNAEFYLQLVERLRSLIPTIALSTDAIVGFPGETDDDFNLTYHLSKECGFSKMHIFPYSKRKGTPAALRSDQVPQEIKLARAQELRKLAKELRKEDFERRIGTEERVVVEAEQRGCTESYYELHLEGNQKCGSAFDLKIPRTAAYL